MIDISKVPPVTDGGYGDSEGLEFVGWFIDGDINKPFDIASDVVVKDIELHAEWKLLTSTVYVYVYNNVTKEFTETNAVEPFEVHRTSYDETCSGWFNLHPPTYKLDGYVCHGYTSKYDIESYLYESDYRPVGYPDTYDSAQYPESPIPNPYKGFCYAVYDKKIWLDGSYIDVETGEVVGPWVDYPVDYYRQELTIGQTVSNKQLCDIFRNFYSDITYPEIVEPGNENKVDDYSIAYKNKELTERFSDSELVTADWNGIKVWFPIRDSSAVMLPNTTYLSAEIRRNDYDDPSHEVYLPFTYFNLYTDMINLDIIVDGVKITIEKIQLELDVDGTLAISDINREYSQGGFMLDNIKPEAPFPIGKSEYYQVHVHVHRTSLGSSTYKFKLIVEDTATGKRTYNTVAVKYNGLSIGPQWYVNVERDDYSNDKILLLPTVDRTGSKVKQIRFKVIPL